MNHPVAPDGISETEFWGTFYRILDETVARCDAILAAAQQAATGSGDQDGDKPGNDTSSQKNNQAA